MEVRLPNQKKKKVPKEGVEGGEVKPKKKKKRVPEIGPNGEIIKPKRRHKKVLKEGEVPKKHKKKRPPKPEGEQNPKEEQDIQLTEKSTEILVEVEQMNVTPIEPTGNSGDESEEGEDSDEEEMVSSDQPKIDEKK